VALQKEAPARASGEGFAASSAPAPVGSGRADTPQPAKSAVMQGGSAGQGAGVSPGTPQPEAKARTAAGAPQRRAREVGQERLSNVEADEEFVAGSTGVMAYRRNVPEAPEALGRISAPPPPPAESSGPRAGVTELRTVQAEMLDVAAAEETVVRLQIERRHSAGAFEPIAAGATVSRSDVLRLRIDAPATGNVTLFASRDRQSFSRIATVEVSGPRPVYYPTQSGFTAPEQPGPRHFSATFSEAAGGRNEKDAAAQETERPGPDWITVIYE
jgi:hypothetical protein